MHCCECLDGWSGGGCGVFIALNPQFNRWGGCCRWAHRTVRCASNVTQPLGFDRWSFVFLWHRTGTVHCLVRLWWLLWLSRALSRRRCPLQPTVALASRCSAGAPDSPVAHQTVRWIIAERGLRNPKVKSLESYGPGAPDTVRWHTGQSGAPDQGTLRFLLLLSFEP
jgi:hypothetical protein